MRGLQFYGARSGHIQAQMPTRSWHPCKCYHRRLEMVNSGDSRNSHHSSYRGIVLVARMTDQASKETLKKQGVSRETQERIDE